MIAHNPKSRKSGQAKRLETLETETKKQKSEFLEHLSKSSIVQLACERSGVGRSTYYNWRSSDEEFAKLADKAKEAGEFLVNDIAESKLIQNIQNNQTTSIIFWLKNHHGGYGDRVFHQHEFVQPEFDNSERIKIAIAMYNAGQFTKLARDEMIRAAGGIPPNIPGEEERMTEVLDEAEKLLKKSREDQSQDSSRVTKISNNPTPVANILKVPEIKPAPIIRAKRKGVNIEEYLAKRKNK